MSSPAITYRTLNPPNNEPQWGQGQSNFLSDVNAVAQAVRTRLLLFEGEWWADLNDGLPLWQSILGQGGNSQAQIALLIQARILGTPYVSGITEQATAYNASTRVFNYVARVQTQFGSFVVANNIPTPPSTALPG